MKWERIPLGPLQTNAYILSHLDGTCVVFDPGSEGGRLVRYIEEQGYQPLAILLTHAHFDHIGAINDVIKKWPVPVYIHEQEREWLSDPLLNGSAYFIGEQVKAVCTPHCLRDEATLTIGNFTFELLETPGHSPGSISYYCREIETVFSGDVLFAGSIGRTDLPGGNYEQLMQSIHDRLLVLPEETVVLSGHGPETTIGTEMDTNPFLHGF
ncbi:glyoxylase-like metal-dependent hydrolase (beta-lactamase superfamily II) [Anoxybacillus tepidamans]|uniref:Glyoxylase-like metal-dependent hydrolase (Beta-lactamase superfamily II) n=1 Tax=Anoxybacteroides tepidamans TaxID=265948 RepID=A0A7W8IQ63_9BACL|nr:MBL fold metallo-hydrolase [Anoxybacillus tepidamans]MBB5324695.1 glyoxylase-like metal-dependent hydrolase (beta-lactamase superfamily II) [Anoxybacillus tepidamans]